MSLKTEKLGRSPVGKHGHSKPAKYRKFVKNQTARKMRRVPQDEAPVQHRHNGYD